MLTRLVQTPKVVAAGLALGLSLCWVPGSQAVVYTGSATDPAGDGSIFMGDVPPDPMLDFTNVAVTYDNVAGRGDVSFTFNRAPAPYQTLHVGVGLGSVQSNGSCSAPYFISLVWVLESAPRGEAVLQADSLNFSGGAAGRAWNDDGVSEPLETWEGTAFFDWPGGAKTTWNFATIHPLLVGRHYSCAKVGMWFTDLTGTGEDWLDSLFFELNPAPAANNPPPPATGPSSGTETPTGSQPAPRFTGLKARRAVKRALARRYGKAFRKRKGYTVTCLKTSPSRWNCSVRWRYGQFVYEGKIKLTLRSDGRVASKLVLRKTIP